MDQQPARVLKRLSFREREILKLLHEGYTHVEVGAILNGIAEKRIRELEVGARGKLEAWGVSADDLRLALDGAVRKSGRQPPATPPN